MLEKLIIYAIVGVAVVVGLLAWHNGAVNKAAEAARASVVQEYTKEYVNSLETQLKSSIRLQTAAEQDIKDLHEQRAISNRAYERIIAGLQQRPSRSEAKQAVSDNSCPAPSNTGASLSREDGEFLAGEAARAERMMEERDLYYRRYNEVKQEMEKLNVQN